MSKNGQTLIKDPYVKTHFPDQQALDDFIKCCDPDIGYLHFMDNFFYIQHPTRGSMLYHPWDYQKRLIHTYHNYRYSISLMPRQTGKCFGINTIVNIRNKKTNIVEKITIGELYERQSKMCYLSDRNEGVAFPFISETSNDSNQVQRIVSKQSNQMPDVTRNKFSEFFRRTQSWFSAWWQTISILQKIYPRKQSEGNHYESRNFQTKERFTHHPSFILDKKNEWEYRGSNSVIVRKTDNIFKRKMYRKTWNRTWIKNLVSAAREMVKVLQENQFFTNISTIVQQNYGKLFFNDGILRYSKQCQHGSISKQRIPISSRKRNDDNARFHRFKHKENNRIRWDILAWSAYSESKERILAGPDDSRKWIPNFTCERRGLQKESRRNITTLPKLSEIVSRKFIESIKISDYEIYTDTGWKPLRTLYKTIPYYVWKIKTSNGLTLDCADTHILFNENMEEVFAKDLDIGSRIKTKYGTDTVISIHDSKVLENMYDVEVDDDNHRFYSNDILSHNSTSAAGYLLWYAMFVPDSTILIAAHKYTGAQEIMQRIRYAYEACPHWIKAGVTTYNKGSLDFENGSRIVSATTTENTGRGMSISLLYLDEFAFVRPSIAELFWTSITPTLATGGKAIITSTPNSDEDQFALIWKGANKCLDEYGNQTDVGVNGFKAFQSYWHEHPERDQKWADQMLAQLGPDRFAREMECKFLIADETLINPNTLIDLEGTEPIDKMGQIRWYKKPEKGNIYAVALDPSLGTGGDPAAIQIFEANTTTQIGEWKHNKTDIPRQIKLLADINKYIVDITGEPENLYYSIENNSIGEAALISLNEYGEHNVLGMFLSEPGKKRKGFNTTQKVKLTACAKFKTLVENKKMKINSKALISEMKAFVASGGSYAAKVGDTDDLVMATLLVVRMLQQLSDYHYNLEEQIRDHEEFLAPLPFFAIIN